MKLTEALVPEYMHPQSVTALAHPKSSQRSPANAKCRHRSADHDARGGISRSADACAVRRSRRRRHQRSAFVSRSSCNSHLAVLVVCVRRAKYTSLLHTRCAHGRRAVCTSRANTAFKTRAYIHQSDCLHSACGCGSSSADKANTRYGTDTAWMSTCAFEASADSTSAVSTRYRTDTAPRSTGVLKAAAANTSASPFGVGIRGEASALQPARMFRGAISARRVA